MRDLALRAIHVSLDGLAARQRIIAENLANVDTPGYLAARVSFESSLREAVSGRAPERTRLSTARSTDPTRVNGNNVDVDTENVSLVETGLRYQLAVESVNAKFRILRAAIRRDG